MNNTKVGLFVFCLLILVTNSKSVIICPAAELIAPCTCSNNEFICRGRNVTQEVLSQVIGTLFSVNQNVINITQGLFIIRETSIYEFDLTPFLGSRVDYFSIDQNQYLSWITGPDPSSELKIETSILDLQQNRLLDEGLQTVFKYFDPLRMESILLDQNLIEGGRYEIGDGSGDVEFLPGITSFPNLRSLRLNSNKISKLGGGQFKRLKNLSRMELQNNYLMQVDEDALILDPPTDTNIVIYFIELSQNALSDATFMKAGGADKTHRVTSLSLSSGSFVYLSSENFQEYFDANDSNYLYVTSSPVFCDQRMKWLHDQADKLQSRVYISDCVNDQGKNVFTTELIN